MTKKITLISLITIIFISQICAQTWTQVGQDIDGEYAEIYFGRSVSLSSDGNILAVSANAANGGASFSGYVKVFQRNQESWIQLGDDINGVNFAESFGWSVSLSSDGLILAAGTSFNNGETPGITRVYQFSSGNWIQLGDDINGDINDDRFGYSVDLSSDGQILAVGAYDEVPIGIGEGYVKVFQNNEGNWEQIGDNILGEAAGDWFGYSVCLNEAGNVLAVGAPNNAGNGTGTGHVRVFQNSEDNWVQIGVDINGEGYSDHLGASVSLSADGSVMAVGAPEDSYDFGYVKIYKNIGGNWNQIGGNIIGDTEGNQPGTSICLNNDGTYIAIGAPSESFSNPSSGNVKVFRNISDTWTLVGEKIFGENTSDRFGGSLCLSSDASILAVGAYRNDGNGTDAGHVRVFESSSGNVYSFQNEFFIHPNPASERIHISKNWFVSHVEIYDITGKTVLSKSGFDFGRDIDISFLKSGIYLIKLQSESEIITAKIIIE